MLKQAKQAIHFIRFTTMFYMFRAFVAQLNLSCYTNNIIVDETWSAVHRGVYPWL
jgi:hypothetical protein